MHFNLFDIIISTIFIGSTLLGGLRGFVITSLNISTFILTIFLTILLGPLSEEIVAEHISSRMAANLISIIVSYLLSRFTCNWLLRLLKEYFENKSGGMVDKTLGLWIGVFRAYLICSLIFTSVGIISSSSYIGAKNYWQIFINVNAAEYPKWLSSSYTYNALQANYIFTKNHLEGGFVQKYLENIDLPKSDTNNVNPVPQLDPEIPVTAAEDLVMNQIQESLDKNHSQGTDNK